LIGDELLPWTQRHRPGQRPQPSLAALQTQILAKTLRIHHKSVPNGGRDIFVIFV
jgi:hypothetical protein